ncbi:MAG: acetate/propionate family kinase [Caulobacterales bacterium]|nr:acetate/propionate family kinase [Caulobacterales bacterium]
MIIVLNAGSSSLKFGLYEPDGDGDPALLLRGQIAGIGHAPHVSAEGPAAADFDAGDPPGAASAPEAVFAWLLDRLHACPAARAPRAVGHRIVHGGEDFDRPARITDDVLTALEALSPLAPQHQPFNLAGVRQAMERWPDAAHAACFDTAFHRAQPRLEQLFAIPRALTEDGVRRYGFHGLSYEWIAHVLPGVLGPRADGKVIVAHLGHGASLCAMRERRSLATTMGFTALDGLMMATRCGALDPGVALHLIAERGMSPAEVERLLYAQSGLLGVSGLTGDMRTLLASDAAPAREAIDLFVHRITGAIGALAARLEGLDALVFTGGVGENAAPIRARAAEGCAWLGARLDAAANAKHAARFETADSDIALCVAPTNEELMIARHAAQLAEER